MEADETKKILNIRSCYGLETSITLHGWSMNPLLKNNDVIQISPSRSYKVGDIIVFAYLNIEVLVHRIINITQDYFVCKGDNSFRLEKVKPDQVYGKIIKVMRNGKSILFDVPAINMKRLCYLSFRIGRNYISNFMNIDKVRKMWSYKLFFELIELYRAQD